MTDAIAIRNQIEADYRAVSKRVSALSDSAPRGALGLTADSVKASPEWKALRAEQAALFSKLRAVNALIAKGR